MATSYTNPKGSGNRTATIVLTSFPAGSGLWQGAGSDPYKIINGTYNADVWWVGGLTAAWLKFDFGAPRMFDAFKWSQFTSAGANHGTWQWAWSDDDGAYTDVGGQFLLGTPGGGAVTSEIFEPAGNTVQHRFWMLRQKSGQTNGGPYNTEIEFRIDDGLVAPATLTLNATDGSDTASVTVVGNPVGTFAVTELPDQLAFTGETGSQGTLAATDGMDTANFAYMSIVSGTLAVSEASDTALFTSNITIGQLVASEAPDFPTFLLEVKRQRPPTINVMN